MYAEKPNYNRRKLKERLYKLKFRLGEEYDEIDFTEINNWCSKVISKSKDLSKKLIIDICCEYEDTGGCDSQKDIITLIPFYVREENDKEYNDRIAKEEKEYNDYLQIKKLEREQNAEYLKDLEEYRRIKNKYHF